MNMNGVKYLDFADTFAKDSALLMAVTMATTVIVGPPVGAVTLIIAVALLMASWYCMGVHVGSYSLNEFAALKSLLLSNDKMSREMLSVQVAIAILGGISLFMMISSFVSVFGAFLITPLLVLLLWQVAVAAAGFGFVR